MLLFLSIFIAILAAATMIAGLLAVLRNPQGSSNRWFLTMTIFIGLWIPCNFINSNIISETWTHLFLRLDFALAPFIAWALLEFVVVIKVQSLTDRASSRFSVTLRNLTLVLNLVLAILSLSGLIATVTITQGKAVVSYSTLYVVYVPIILGYFIYAFVKLFYKRNKASGAEKGALNFIAAGFLAAVTANVLTNLLFPLAFTSRATIVGLNTIGYMGLLVLVIAIYLAITTQKLFDIRLIVARSAAYILSLSTLTALFLGVSFVATSALFSDGLSNSATRWVYGSLSIIVALLFPRLKKFFDRITNSIFFRDAYDSQAYLDHFNKVLVSTYSINPILRKSALVIQENLKPAYCMFGVRETSSSPRRITGTTGHPNFSEQDISFVRSLTPNMRRKLIITDDLEPEFSSLKIILQNNKIAVIARLAATNSEEGIGYLILGPKKSGNPYSSQDIKMIEITANELVIAIQNALHTEEIEKFNLTLQARVDDATRKLRATNEKLKQMDETKDDFISMASHQLRTPLTSVKGYISMVLEEDAGKITPTQRDMLGQAFFSSQRMVYLIADLLNVSRLKTGKFIIDRAPVHLDQVVQQELRQLQETAAARSLTLQFDKPETFPVMLLDETKTRQIIMNFIDNAIYYTPAGGHITVSLINNEHSVELHVADNGIGVPKNEQQHLFTKFYRAGNARQARPDGTGLGLYMAKKVIVAQGGSLIFDSQEGKGSTFGFIFSKSLAADSDPLAPIAEIAVQPEAEPVAAAKPAAQSHKQAAKQLTAQK